MKALEIAVLAVVILALLVLLVAYVCYRMAFYAARKKTLPDDVIDVPDGKVYRSFHPQFEAWGREVRAMPHEAFQITSFDGLKLCAKFYEYAPGAPIELMFHGYRGNAERDLSGGVQRCFSLGRSAFIVDQRCSGGSDGHVITFGIREHRDCLAWVDFMVEHFGPEVKIILCGISMGASTVLMAAGNPLPPNVIGVLSDCGFSTAKDIIKKVIRQIGLPAGVCYPFVKLGARLFGRFDLEETSALEAVARCTLPVIFFHGEDDDFVPCEMSRINYEACAARKMLVTVPGADHGLSFPVAPETYLAALREFFGPEASYQEQPAKSE